MNKSVIAKIAAGITTVALLVAAPLAAARDRVDWSVSIGVPGIGYPAYGPVYQQPQVVYQRPQPIYVEPAPVYYQPRPVYVRPAPVYAPSYGPVYYDGYYGKPRHWDRGGHHGHRHHGHRHGGYHGR